MHGVPTSVLKTKARITSTVLQYHSWLGTASLLVTDRAHLVRRIALLFSRDAASHSRRVFRLGMLNCLTALVDQCADSVGLPAMSHLEQLTSLFSRQEYCILRLHSLESTVVRVYRIFVAALGAFCCSRSLSVSTVLKFYST